MFYFLKEVNTPFFIGAIYSETSYLALPVKCHFHPLSHLVSNVLLLDGDKTLLQVLYLTIMWQMMEMLNFV